MFAKLFIQRVPMIRPKTPRRSPEKGCGGTKDGGSGRLVVSFTALVKGGAQLLQIVTNLNLPRLLMARYVVEQPH